MKTVRRAAFLACLLSLTACGGGGGGGGGSPPPPPPAGPTITGPVTPLPVVTVDVAMTPITFTATGTGAITWTITAGALPPGLALSIDGVLSGTPTAPGTYFFTVTATDSNGSDSDPYSQAISSTSSENEPNDDASSANPLAVGTYGTGVITVGDIDFWSFPAAADQVIRIELLALRREFSSWDANANRPRLNLIGPNGTDFLIGHDFDSAGTAGWSWGDHDLDIPLFRIPAAGLYYVRVSAYLAGSQGGSYAVRVSDVTPGSLQTETETNDDSAGANAITPGLVYGFHDDGNDDFFSFDISQPTIVSLELTSYRNGVFGIGGAADDDYFDGTIELLDTDGTTVLATNYRVFFQDPALNFHFDASGTYFIRITESIDGTDGDAGYFLSYAATPVGSVAESEPNDDASSATSIAYGDVVTGDTDGSDIDFYSFSGNAGDIVRVFAFDPGASQTADDFVTLDFMLDDFTILQRAVSSTGVNGMACMRAILPSTGTFYIRMTPDGGPTSYAFQLVQFMTSTFESEGNDSVGTADAIPGSGRVSGAINASGDVDVFSFGAQTGEVVVFSIYAGPGSSSNGFPNHSSYTTALAALLPTLEVVTGAGTTLALTPYAGAVFSGESVTHGLATSEVTFVAPSADTFFIRVTASDNAGSDDHRYVLEKR